MEVPCQQVSVCLGQWKLFGDVSPYSIPVVFLQLHCFLLFSGHCCFSPFRVLIIRNSIVFWTRKMAAASHFRSQLDLGSGAVGAAGQVEYSGNYLTSCPPQVLLISFGENDQDQRSSFIFHPCSFMQLAAGVIMLWSNMLPWRA